MADSRPRAPSAPSSVRSIGTDGFHTPPEEGTPFLGAVNSAYAEGGANVVVSSASIRTARSKRSGEATPATAELGEISDIDASNGSVTAVKSTAAGSIFAREPAAAAPVRSSLFIKWRRVVVVSLLAGYMGYYFNRSNLSVAQDAIIEDTGLSPSDMSIVLSIGYGVYAFGKFTSGIAVDYFGGRPLFLIGLFGSAVFTVLFTLLDSLAWFAAMWSANRFLQSVGWGALVKITSQWFDSSEYGRIMGIMSLSYMFGDSIIRIVFGIILGAGLPWEQLFYISAAIAVAIGLVLLYTLKPSPVSIGEPEPQSNVRNVYAKEGEVDTAVNKGSVMSLLRPLLTNPMFWTLMLMSLILTMIREMFNAWLPTYLKNVIKMDDSEAAYASALFPFAGTISAILGGFLVDRVSARQRGGVPIVFLAGLTCSLMGLWAFNNYFDIGAEGSSAALAIALILVAAVGLTLIAPYSFLDGIFIMNLSGKRGSASAASLVNAAGYVGAIVSPYIVSLVVAEEDDGNATEWAPVFIILACLTVVTAIANGVYWYLDVKDQDQQSELDTSEHQSLISKS